MNITRFNQSLKVTGLLAACGGIAGAIGGGLIGAGALVLAGAASSISVIHGPMRLGVLAGTFFGMAIGPIASWTLLRRVPIGRAVVWLSLTTLAVDSAALAMDWRFWPTIYASLAAIGVVAAGLRLYAEAEVSGEPATRRSLGRVR